MQEKINWYQEVVDLEPGSKLFFPLAKMLAEQDAPRAIKTLQRGLDRHPEFIEARFYFVELLHKHKEVAEYASLLQEQFSVISPMLSRYAGFWQAWGKTLADEDGGQDKALAASFLGAMCTQQGLSMTDIFAAGLRSLTGQESALPQEEASEVAAVPVAPVTLAAPLEVSPEEVNTEEVEAEVASEEPVKAGTTLSVSGKINLNTKKNVPTPAQSAQSVKTAPPVAQSVQAEEEISEKKNTAENPSSVEDVNEENEHNEVFSLRTRSMADVLAEQGDYAAALEIYQELVQSAQSADEKQELEAKIVSLQAMETSPMDASLAAQAKTPSPGNERVISVLGALADRLDARLHS